MKEEERKERDRRIEDSKYNREYGRLRTEELPKYLQEKSNGKKLKMAGKNEN